MTNDPSKDRPLFAQPPAAEETPTTEFDVQQATEVDLRPVTPAGAAREQAGVPVDHSPLSGDTADLPGDDLLVPPPTEPADDEEVLALRGVTFPLGLRGYNTHAVDRYVDAVERCIARFEESRSPTEAVRRALDRVGEQTAAILQEAERSAEETTTSSRAQADDRLQRAEAEAADVWTAAQARAKRLDDDIERLWEERQRLIAATRVLAERLRSAADDAEAAFPPEDPAPASTTLPTRGPGRLDPPGVDEEDGPSGPGNELSPET